MNEREIFDAALQIPGDETRSAYLQEACGSNDRLREQIEGLLRAEQQLGSFLANPLPAFSPTIDMPAAATIAEAPGAVVGPYKLLQQIGEGGMGVVYMAEQSAPVRRRVALKIIKPGMDTREVIARFEAERQALALMDHSNIARVFDAGATAAGRPYFVMELVRGVPITDFCDQNNLPVHERLELFVTVCHAVQHAHQKGIIHRDIKPSNVLVTLHDGQPVPKVIDFGVAKAIGQQLTDKTLYTQLAQMVGTPLYMSPEQAQLTGQDVDTRGDIYSLGVLLYELLTGSTPLARGSMKKAALEEVRRMIREEAPPSPSMRLSSTAGEAQTAVAAHRRLDPRGLSRLVRGDLDWIVMKALEKDRTRRYETANGFAADIARYLCDEPVEACPPSSGYRFRKFARRNRVTFAIGTTVTAALLVAVVALAVSNALVRRESDAKELALEEKSKALGEKVAALGQKEQALNEKQEALQTARFQEGLAKQNAATAEERSRELSRRLYLAQMNLAGNSALDPRGTARVLELTSPWQPRAGEQDRRGWEWYCLDAFCNSDRLTLRGHTHNVASVAWNATGTRIASGSWDGTARISETATGTVLLVLRGHHGSVHSVAWNPQASQLATASFDGTITIWDGETGAEIRSLVGHAGSVHSAVWSPDGKQIVSAGADRNLMIWDAATGRKMRTLAGHDDEVLSAAWSPDGRWIASGGRGGVVKAWDAATGMSRRSLRSEGYEVRCVAWSPDSTRLASAGGDGQNCRIWDVESGQQIHQLLGHLYEINSVDWSPDGTQLVTACRDKAIRIWDAASGQQTTMVHGHTGGVSAARWSPNGKEIASSSQDQTVKLWNVKAGAEKLTFRGHTGAVFGVGWSPDGRKIATASEDHLVKVWDAATGRLLQNFIGHTAGVLAVAWSPDGTCLASAGDDRVIVVWNSTTGEQMSSLRGNTAQVESVAWSPDSSQLAAAGHDQTLRVWNAATGETVRGLSFASRARTVAWSPDGRRLALTLESECARVFDTTTWTELVQLSDHVLGLAWSPDGTRLATSHPQGVVKIWNSQTGAELFALRGHATWSNSVAWSPDGRRLASTSEDCTTKIWDTSDGSLALTLPGSGNWFFSAAWSPDGRSLAATSYDHTLRVWRTERAYERDRSPFILPALNRRLAVDPADIHTLCARADVYQKLARPDDAKTDRAAARRMAEQRLREQPDDEAMAFELVDMFRDEIERNCSERWQILTPVEVKSAGGATLTILADGSVLAGGMNPVHELYTVGLESNQANIVALRLETLPHPSLPFGGSGRALINGNFHLAELTVSREPRHGISEKTAVAIASAFSDIAGDGGRSIRLALDGDPGTQWTPFPDQSTWHQACLQFAHSVDGRSARLVIAVDSGTDHKTAQAIGRFRISVTSDPDAVLMERLRHVSATHWASARCRLGAALFLVGDFAAAAEQLERIVLHRGRGEGLELMLLALAHHRLDHGPEANRWHAAAIEWGARNSADESLTEFAVECTQRIRGNTRAEFIRLLGEQKLHHAAFYQWRANLSAEAGDSESAAADYNQAIDRLPLDVRSALPRSTLVGAVIRTPPPVFEALLKLRQDAPRLLLFRGRVKAMQKDWKQAAEDYTRAAASRPAGEECFEHAGVLLLAGDVEGYCAFAQGLAQQHGETKDPVMAFILARTAALGLESPVESCRMIAWGEQAVAGEKYPWYLHALGLALYRAHRYDEAAARLEQSLAGEWNTEGALLNHLALSLTNLRQDRPDESQQHVEKARDLAASIESDAGVSDSIIVHDWLEYHILLRELEATIQRNSVP